MANQKPTVPNAFKWPFPDKISRIRHFKSCCVMFAVGMWSKLMLKYLNNLEIYNEEALEYYSRKREKGKPLITVANHASCLDDPVLWGMLSWKTLKNENYLRWSLGAQELLFTNRFHSWLFSHGKVIPVVRGDGVYQKGIDYALEKLNCGGWVHVFPEGKVNMTGGLIRLKWGVGRLIAECKMAPIILPFWHVGMDDMLPNQRPYIPRIKQKITVLIGEPVDCTSTLEYCKRSRLSVEKTRKILTDQIQEKFSDIKAKAELLHSKRFVSTK
eukprot:gene6202-6917_t